MMRLCFLTLSFASARPLISIAMKNRVNLEKCRRGSVFVDVKKNMSDRLYSLSLRKNEGSLIVTWLNTRKIS